jgi:serine/threonine-protein kinase HipA
VISAYPILGHGRNRLAPEKAKLAMSVRGRGKHYHWDRITRRHWEESAAAWGMGPQIEGILSELIEETDAAITRVSGEIPAGFPSSVADPILNGLKRAARRLVS